MTNLDTSMRAFVTRFGLTHLTLGIGTVGATGTHYLNATVAWVDEEGECQCATVTGDTPDEALAAVISKMAAHTLQAIDGLPNARLPL